MKKIIALFDGNNFSEGLLSFAEKMNEREAICLTGIFISALDYSSLWANPLIESAATMHSMMPEQLELADQETEKNIMAFESYCLKNGITFRTHNDTGDSLFEAVRKESRFADLMLISNELFFRQAGEQPNDYLKDVLHFCECPILLIPEDNHYPQRIVLTYDGSASSVFAIKYFSYLFPDLCKKEATLISDHPESDEIPDKAYIEELVVQHYPKLNLHVLEKETGVTLASWLSTQPDPVVVAGAYSRSGMSRLFKKSYVNDIIKNRYASIFIAHK